MVHNGGVERWGTEMPYLVLVSGTVGLVVIWVTYLQLRVRLAQVRKASEDDAWVRHEANERLTGRVLGSVIGSAVILWAMWGWGVQAIHTQNEQVVREQKWFVTYATEHQRAWNEDCDAFFSRFFSDVAYNTETGQAMTLDWCKSQWRPPAIPADFSTDDRLQPDYVEPRANQVIFGPDLRAWVCVSQDDCYSWDDFVSPPADLYGW